MLFILFFHLFCQ